MCQNASEKVLLIVFSYIVHYDTLLQNTTDIFIKYDSYIIKKCNKKNYYKMCQVFYDKMRQIKCDDLLENATLITKCVGTNT